MPKHEVFAWERPGRRPAIQRLLYRPQTDAYLNPKSSRSTWHENRDWSTIKDQLRRTVRRAPEVVISVKGSRRSSDGYQAAIEGVLRYMMYISRSGHLSTINEQGEQLNGRETVRDIHASWDLDMQRTRGAKDEVLHPSFNIIFSMPAKTDPEKMLEAVRAFASQRFQGHQYILALHTRDTDPADDPPEHPHVHLILRAEDVNGRRIHIRKTDLRSWREDFASQLRARGIEANATSRAERGQSFKSKSGAEWHVQRRYEEALRQGRNPDPPKARTARFQEAAKELQDGLSETKPWETAMAARRRDVLRDLAINATKLRQEGDNELADRVEQFMQDLPPLDSERRQVQRALVEQVKKRLQERDKGRQNEPQR